MNPSLTINPYGLPQSGDGDDLGNNQTKSKSRQLLAQGTKRIGAAAARAGASYVGGAIAAVLGSTTGIVVLVVIAISAFVFLTVILIPNYVKDHPGTGASALYCQVKGFVGGDSNECLAQLAKEAVQEEIEGATSNFNRNNSFPF